jgi:hypothetical protein
MSAHEAAALAEPTPIENPFPGLRSFEPDEDHLFFGRETQIDELLARLRRTRFLAVVGTSGSGKSSLVRSGVIPSLHSGFMVQAGSSWRIAILRPGSDPIGNLAAALDVPDALGGDPASSDFNRALLEATLLRSAQGLAEAVRQARMPEADNLLVVVDQFEELFRFKNNRQILGSGDQALAFVKLLLEAARDEEVPVYVVLTMRSDFIGNCTEFPGLAEATNDGQYLVPRMSREERRSAIVGPAAVGGAEIAPRLVTRLLNDVGDDPDQLPTLQHALMRTWDHWRRHHTPGEPVDLRHYEAIGTLSEALSLHAEEAYGELDGDRGRQIAEVLFKALTDRGSDARGIRRPCTLEEICALTGAGGEEVVRVVEAFRRPGRSFLMPPAGVPLGPSTILDISHESLMRIWTRLIDWVEEEARAAQIYLRLSRAAARYQEGAAGLLRDPELQLSVNWREESRPTAAWAERYDVAFDRAMLYLEYSQRERDLYLERRERERRRQLRRARWLAVVLGSAAAATLALGLVAYTQMIDAEQNAVEAARSGRIAETAAATASRQRALADAARREALTNAERAREHAAEAEENALLALDNERRALDNERRAVTNQELARESSRRAQENALAAEASATRARASERDALAAREAALSEKERADRLRMRQLARALALQTSRLPDGQAELAALLARQAYRFNLDNGGRRDDPDVHAALAHGLAGLDPEWQPVLRAHRDAVRAVALAPDGATLASAGEDGRLLLFDLSRPGAAPRVLAELDTGLRAAAFDPRGRALAAGGADGSVRVWDLAAPERPPAALPGHPKSVESLAFAAGGGLLASAGLDGGVRLHRLDGGAAEPLELPRGSWQRVRDLAFGPDGRALAAATDAGAVLWPEPAAGGAPRAVGPARPARSVALSPDGRRLAIGGERGPIVLEDLRAPGGAGPIELSGHASAVTGLAFDPAGETLVSSGLDGQVVLWNAADPSLEPVLLSAGHRSWVWGLALAPDGAWGVSAGEDRTVRRWLTRTEALAAEVCRRLDRDLTPEEWQAAMPADVPRRPVCP